MGNCLHYSYATPARGGAGFHGHLKRFTPRTTGVLVVQSLTIHAASPDTGRAILAALSPFRTEMLEARDGHCEIAVLLGRDDSEVVAVLNSLEHYVTERETGPARVDFNGRSYVMYAGPGDLTE